MEIIYTDKREYTTEQLQALFKSVDWRSADYPERLKKALDHCETVYTAWCKGRLIVSGHGYRQGAAWAR